MLATFLLGKALPLLLKVLVGPLTYLLGRVFLNAWRSLDDLNPGPKRAIVFIIALCISAFVQLTGQTLPSECADVGIGELTDGCVTLLSSAGFLNTVLTAVIGAGLGYLLHSMKKANPLT